MDEKIPIQWSFTGGGIVPREHWDSFLALARAGNVEQIFLEFNMPSREQIEDYMGEFPVPFHSEEFWEENFDESKDVLFSFSKDKLLEHAS